MYPSLLRGSEEYLLKLLLEGSVLSIEKLLQILAKAGRYVSIKLRYIRFWFLDEFSGLSISALLFRLPIHLLYFSEFGIDFNIRRGTISIIIIFQAIFYQKVVHYEVEETHK